MLGGEDVVEYAAKVAEWGEFAGGDTDAHAFDDLGGPWGDLPPETRQPMARGSLPVSERIHDTCFWLSTPVDPNPEWVEQTAEAFEKVARNGPRLAEIEAGK